MLNVDESLQHHASNTLKRSRVGEHLTAEQNQELEVCLRNVESEEVDETQVEGNMHQVELRLY